MKVDLTQRYENADGTPAVLSTGSVPGPLDAPLTLKYMLIQALLSDVDENRQPVPSSEKIKRYDLYRSINKSQVGFVLLKAEDIAFLKKVALVLPTLTAGQTQTMLETPFVEPQPAVVVSDE
jgi:hypothetical protein